MDEQLTLVNDSQVSDEGSQIEETEPVTEVEVHEESQEESVNADEAGVTPDKPVQSKEDNAQFAKVRREAEAKARAEFESRQAARDAEFAERAARMGWVDSNGQPIKSEDAYWREVDLQAQLRTMVDEGMDTEKALLKIENQRIKSERESELKARADQEKQKADYQAFFEFFREVNGRDFTPSDEIPADVFRISQEKQIPIKYAYAEVVAKQAREKEKSIGIGKKTAEANAKNAQTTAGSVTGNGQADNAVLTEELISAMSPKEMERRWGDIKKFYKMK